MTDDRSIERAARSWLEVGPTQAPERAVQAALLQIDTTPQERDWHVPWRLPKMTTPARVAAAAVVGVLAIGGALFILRPGDSSVGGPGPMPTPTPTPAASPTPSPSPMTLHDGPLAPGTYVTEPFAQPGSDACGAPPQPGCLDTTDDDSVRVTLTVPAGWSNLFPTDAEPAAADGASLIFTRGASLFDDPCRNDGTPEIQVGPTVDDFVDVVAAHPLLDVTTPSDVALAGYSGKYLELQVPTDLTGCEIYRPWEPWYYAQGPGERWHLWVLDVEGVRVVVQGMDHAGTSAQHQAELQAIVDSIRIEP
jgi:hypothetical protein